MRSTKSSGHKKKEDPFLLFFLITLSLFSLSVAPNRFLVEPEILDFPGIIVSFEKYSDNLVQVFEAVSL